MKWDRLKLVIAAAAPWLALTLSGCAVVPKPAPSEPAPSVATPTVVQVQVQAPPEVHTPAELARNEEYRQLSELLGFAQRLGQMNADEQRRELNNLNTILNRDKSIERALPARLRLALLLSQPGGAAQDDARALNLLEPYIGASATGPLKQFAVFLHGELTERGRQQRRADQMKEQLDALRAVERSIIERGQAPHTRKP
jgi:hypothetical protein